MGNTKILIPVKLDANKRIIPKGAASPAIWWRVTLGKRWTGSAKKRHFFRTEKAAKKFIAETTAAVEARGHSAFQISPGLALEAIELAEQLKPYGASLTDAVKVFLRQASSSSLTINQLIPRYIQTKGNSEYRQAQRIALRVFGRAFGDKPISAIHSSAIERWLDSKQWKPLNRNNYRRDVSMFFGWAKRQGHIGENPVITVPKLKVRSEMPCIYTVAEAEQLLVTALQNPQLELLGMYAVGLFAGVRVRELRRMSWSMFDWAEKEIRIGPTITKTGSPRNIAITDVLVEWLGPRLPGSGLVVGPTRLRRRRKTLHELAGVPIKPNGLRHTFATFHAAKYRNISELQLIMGQRTPDVLFKHYIVAVSRADASAFFDLRPSPDLPSDTDTPGVGCQISNSEQIAA
jgi:integrase